MVCIRMYLYVWYVLACMVCIRTYGKYWYVVIRIGWYMYVLPVLPVLYVFACMVCMAGICTYCMYYTYWYVLVCIVGICVYCMYCPYSTFRQNCDYSILFNKDIYTPIHIHTCLYIPIHTNTKNAIIAINRNRTYDSSYTRAIPNALPN